jgi:hypothetical protein
MALWARADLGNLPETSPEVQALLAESRERRRRHFSRREWRAEIVVGGAFVLAALALALSVPPDRSLDPVIAALVVLMMALASQVRFEVASCYTMPTQLVLVPALFMLPPQAVPGVVALGLAAGKAPQLFRSRAPLESILLPLGDSWFSLGPAAVMALAGSPGPSDGAWLLVPAVLAQFLVETLATAAREWLHGGAGWREQLAEALWVYRVDALLTPIGLALAIAAEPHEAAVLAFVLPLLALLRIFARERSQRIDSLFELSEAYRGTARVLAQVVEYDDAYTGRHTRGVVELAGETAAQLGLMASARRNVELAALLHDVGKITIPKEIINKQGGLTDQEWALIKTHTVEGQQMLDQIGGLMSEIGGIIRSAHENFDGSGYPDGLRGERIPMESRVILCCDAFNAMTTDRPYRKGRAPDAALAELRAHAGSQFDPRVVEALAMVVERDLATARADSWERLRHAARAQAGAAQALAGASSR